MSKGKSQKEESVNTISKKCDDDVREFSIDVAKKSTKKEDGV